MKLKTCVLTVLVVLFTISAGTEEAGLAEGFRLGDLAPRIESMENESLIEFSDQPGRYTLVHFWAVFDAPSRVRNMQLWRKMNELDSTRLSLYSISMDEKKSVFTETVKADDLEQTNQLHETLGCNSPVFRNYNLKKGMQNFLVDDKGVIIAKNVAPEDLAKWIN